MGLQILTPHAEAELRAIAAPLVAACPDMRQSARDTAAALLRKHNLSHLDPDQVYLNRFDAAQSSPRTFSGWQHLDPPVQSFTLPQLVMHRFDVHDQDNSDLLSYLTGFYSNGPGPGFYDEHNEIRLEPQAVLEDFWQIDFSTQFHHRLQAFWQEHAEHFRVLAKVNFLAKVIEMCAADSSTALAHLVRRVATALTGLDIASPTLEQLQAVVPPAAGYRVCTFDIGGHVASDFLRIVLEDGSQLLYTPGETEALHFFPTRQDLYWWVLNNTNEAENRTRFMAHFPLSSRAQKDDRLGLNHLVDLLFFNWGGDDHKCLNQLDSTLSGDAFSHLRDAAHQRMIDDAQFALRSNADLRKQLWIGYLKAFGQVAGPMAAVDWPIALAVVGAGLADMGLNIDQAVNGHTTSERQAGVTGAIFAAIDTLFNAAMLAGAVGAGGEETLIDPPVPEGDSLATEAEEAAPATSAEIEAWVPEPFRPVDQQELLAPFETNIILSAEAGSGGQEGIYLQDGKFYAVIDERPFEVRYVQQMGSWVVIDPQNPYSFYRNLPIRMTADGQWQPLQRSGLQGGGLPRKLLGAWGRRSDAPAVQPLPATPYEIPSETRPLLEAAANAPGEERALSGVMGSLDPQVEASYRAFRASRDALATDAVGYLENVIPSARPAIPTLPRDASAKLIIRSLYQNSEGLFIGESHSGLGSKQFLIDNMPVLKREKIKVLYVEHFMTDFHQADLDVFNRSGKMPARLSAYVNNLDEGHGVDLASRYSFRNVLIAAQKSGIRIQSIDCMASYRQAWANPPSAVIRQQMMNFYAHGIIEADQAVRGPSRWVALVGNSHASDFEGVRGVSELQGAISLRVEDIEVGLPGGIGADPGLAAIDEAMEVRRVRSDLRLQVAIKAAKPAGWEMSVMLRHTGTFTFESTDGQLQLVHRSRAGGLVSTPIVQEGERFHIRRPEWPWISERRLANLRDMRTLLEQHGLRYVLT
ncbi:MAG TPA: hypothetical protein DCP84_01585 [Pseudomonas sp.]|nr:hypothetical protein [Pseudomonas sp.]